MRPKNAIFVEHRMYQDMLCEIAAELNVGRVIDVPAKFKEMASALTTAHSRIAELEREKGGTAPLRDGMCAKESVVADRADIGMLVWCLGDAIERLEKLIGKDHSAIDAYRRAIAACKNRQP